MRTSPASLYRDTAFVDRIARDLLQTNSIHDFQRLPIDIRQCIYIHQRTGRVDLNFFILFVCKSLDIPGIGFLIGLPTLRTRGSYFAIATMCFGVIISIVAGNWIEVTGGFNGIVAIPPPTPISIPFLGPITFQSQTAQYYLVLAFLMLTLGIMHRLVNSLLGLSFMAIRNNEVLAEAAGIATFAGKVLSFVVANFFAGLVIICFGYFMPLGTTDAGETAYLTNYIHEFHWLGIAFASLVVMMLVFGAVKPQEPWVHRHSGDVDLTPWKYTPLAAVGLIVLVLLIYAVFADFSVLG